ncbi:hypothetical protein TNCV_4791311 [Trichonephila clavipes]|nr:hypothetical protein TNCV_4791311 [Trichonephila clavipes]
MEFNGRTHVSQVTAQKMSKRKYETIPHLPCSPDSYQLAYQRKSNAVFLHFDYLQSKKVFNNPATAQNAFEEKEILGSNT